MAEFICPSCGIEHEVEIEDEAYYDGLCGPCEKAWVESDEYKNILAS